MVKRGVYDKNGECRIAKFHFYCLGKLCCGFLALILCLLGIIFGEPVELSLLIKIPGIILLSVWGLYVVVSIATYKTVIITKDKIDVKKTAENCGLLIVRT